MENKSVRYSRAGDAFHYRWAARRCLRMIDPKSSLKCVTIESSKEFNAAGEYVIDLAEYSENETDGKTIAYFQLKHTTVRTGKKFALTELKSTLAGFAKRYSACFIQNRGKFHKGAVTFSFVTNRPVSIRLKQGIDAIRIGSNAPSKLQNDLERITKLTGAHLYAFCASLTFKDGEGDYIVQKTNLRGEMAEYIAGFIDSTEVDNLIALIADRALPESEDHRKNGEIYPEDILRRLDVTSERDLFPAPPEFEKLPHIIKREQHQDILKHILTTPGPTIIHAAGGVGKSVVAQQLVDSLPSGSVGIIYDCFGAGKYRNISEPRHRAQDALVQMANEMATRGLCRPLISRLGTPPDVLFRGFKDRIRQASNKLREVNKDALLVLLIDAADNAEVAANENNEKSFARALLRESIPSTCRLIAFCRTERRDLLEPLSTVQLYELDPFSKAETALHLRRHHPNATNHDIEEFHRLTGGNPRVQAYALNAKHNSVDAVLTSLGPAGTTVNDQIADQLRSAISGIKDKSPQNLKSQVDAVCRGLANLPPFIPLEVLAKAAGVDIPTIKSFVSDLGRPLWHSDDAVQFRDEPTETWFRQTFSAGKDQINQYASTLEPLAKKYTYVAKVLPQLLLKSENYQRLVTLALSNELLPENNPIDERDIRVYRLQFAFKAALKLRHLADAAHLAFRAGEEVAGDKRQLELLQQNIDLIAPLQDTHRVQELAHRQLFHCAWLGSENLYSASLLSSVKDFHGEARSFLRAARKWLNIYFEERDLHKKNEAERSHLVEQLKINDLAEFAWIYYNLYGAAEAVKFMTGWKPPGVVLRISSLFVQRLVDAGRFDEIDKIAHLGTKNPYLMLAVTDELAAVAKFPPKQSLKYCLDLLTNPKTRIPKPQQHAFEDTMAPVIISFAEASAARGLSHKKISALLEFYTAAFADRSVVSEFPGNSRRTFFRGAALRAAVAGHFKPEIKTLLPPKDDSKKATHSDGENEKELTQIIDVLLPWHMLRARLLVCDSTASEINLEALFSATESTLEHRYRIHDRLPFEISRVHFEVLALKKVATSQELESFANNVIHNPQRKFTLIDCLRAVRASFRLQHLAVLRIPLEESCSSAIEAPGTEGPEERSNSFIELARAVLPVSQADAAAYFNQAIEAVSKFGDEMVERWEAVVAVAKRAAAAKRPVPELAYRFIRCGEMVGDTVAREKYWNRNAVFRTAIHLDAPGTFAALSRWRDRNVGWFDDQLEALATEAVKSGILNPVTGWCLSAFEGCNNSADFAATCIRQECNISIRQHILDTAIRDFELSNAPKESWQTLEAVADEFHLQKGKLPVFQSASSTKYSPCHPPTPSASLNKRNKTPDWNKLFKGINLLGPNGVSEAIGAFHKLQLHSSFDDFWRELVRRIPAGKEIDFLNNFIATDNLDIYNVDRVITAVRTTWSQKAAVKALWPALLKRIGRHFAPVLANGYHLNFWIRHCHLKDEDVAMLKNAMLDGLAESLDLVDASTFFGFIRQVSGRITEAEACDLLNFSITRFELHIPNDFGDGLWAEWLSAPAEAPDAVTGLIWAALGSPHAAMRWEAAHCVRRLADNSCIREINSLIGWMQKGEVGPFGSHHFPFYSLHAKLYLLIALARVAVDNPGILKNHSKIFADIALDGLPHVLIQKTAADLALSVERHQPGTYPPDIPIKLQQVGKSPFPPKMVKGYGNTFTTPWHANGAVNTNLKLHFGYDFDRYWFEPLGRLFGVSENQVTALAREIAIRDLKIPESEEYLRDPRQEQWNALDNRGSRGTWSDHGEYPRIDNYSFYYSYHSYFAVAAQLILHMPVLRRVDQDYEEDEWHEKLKWHLLTRSDGRWLADRRDPAPLKRRRWTKEQGQKDWLWGINADDFFDCLSNQNTLPQSLCVSGYWTDHLNSEVETINISSALVNPETTSALANAMRSCEDPFGFGFLHYSHNEAHFNNPPFELTPWLRRTEDSGGRLDKFDPYAKEISYPPDKVMDSIVTILGLSADSEHREWRLLSRKEPSLICEIWSDKNISGISERDEPFRSGNRINATIELLKKLCAKTGKELILSVNIERREQRSYRLPDEERVGYMPPSHKIFILSSNGILKDAEKSYQLG